MGKHQIVFSKSYQKKRLFYVTVVVMAFFLFYLFFFATDGNIDSFVMPGLTGFIVGVLGVVIANRYYDLMYIDENSIKPKELFVGLGTTGKRDQQHQIILAIIDTLDYEPLQIPTGGKARIKDVCLNRVRVFTDDGFKRAWQDGLNAGLFRLLESDKFSSK